MTRIADFIRAFAAPVAWRGPLDAEAARARIEVLYAATSAGDLAPIFDWFSTIGHRRDYSSYEAHAGGAWVPDPRDRYVARKAAFTIGHRDRMKGRPLVALDAMRASALAGWAVTAGLLDDAQATARVAPIAAIALEKHRSWSDFAEQLLLGLEFAEGKIEPALRAAIEAIDGPAWPEAGAIAVPDAIPLAGPIPSFAPPVAMTTDEGAPTTARALTVLAMRLAVDCPGCEHALAFGDVIDRASCRLCGTQVTLAPADWAYFFASDAQKRRRGIGEDDCRTNDFGDRLFSRRLTTKVTAPACPCGVPIDVATLTAGIVACSCGRSSSVRPADACALAIDAGSRFVVAPLPKPIDPRAKFACAACGAPGLIGEDPSRVRPCAACNELTFIDDSAHRRSFDSPRRPTFYLLVAG